MFMVLSSWHSHCESSPGSCDECRLSAGWPPTLRPNQPIWAVSPPKDWLLSSADTIAIYYYYSARKQILILPSHGGGRLSRPRHCSKGAQPVPRAVYRSDCRDKHDRSRWDSNLHGSSRTAVGRPTTKPPRPGRCFISGNLDYPTYFLVFLIATSPIYDLSLALNSFFIKLLNDT